MQMDGWMDRFHLSVSLQGACSQKLRPMRLPLPWRPAAYQGRRDRLIVLKQPSLKRKANSPNEASWRIGHPMKTKIIAYFPSWKQHFITKPENYTCHGHPLRQYQICFWVGGLLKKKITPNWSGWTVTISDHHQNRLQRTVEISLPSRTIWLLIQLCSTISKFSSRNTEHDRRHSPPMIYWKGF